MAAALANNWPMTQFALIPGRIEVVDRAESCSMELRGVAWRAKIARNALYIGLTLLVIGIIGLAAGSSSGFFTAAVIVGALVSLVSAKKLYDDVHTIVNGFNIGPAQVAQIPALIAQMDAFNARIAAAQV